ncbi:hypothetical protein CIHG_09083 [Coccidioides immitis H538.4]|uniref:Uncharacterized protein n=2 Tax=Coccidioides immitis TaxID=5501 RepID=A0A0J8S369_COCIT|nr:hypothetical protein CIRG_05907 [Coccidioides immitis RMSCC 2394]KMU91271.1 hypothetical protein CIHG_09083 [Coccidioides immitis H538.4]
MAQPQRQLADLLRRDVTHHVILAIPLAKIFINLTTPYIQDQIRKMWAALASDKISTRPVSTAAPSYACYSQIFIPILRIPAKTLLHVALQLA